MPVGLGVVDGNGVFGGGKIEKGVVVFSGVHVGRGVKLGVTWIVGVCVQVGSNFIGVIVPVGIMNGTTGVNGGRGLRGEYGFINTYRKYAARHNAKTKTTIERISQIAIFERP
jgi:hypothetical protein